MADPIGATLTIDISNLKESLEQANKLIRSNESNWLANASAMDDWTKSEEGLTDRMRFLSKTIEQQEKNVEGLTKAKNEAIEKYGEESVEVERINKSLTTQSKNLIKSRKEYSQVSSSLDKMSKENNEANEEIKDTTKESKKASKSLDTLEKSAKDAGDGFTIAKGAIAGFIANGLTAIVSMAGNAVSSLFGLTESTAEYRREMARITTVADQVGVSGDRIIDKWIDVNSVINDESSVTEGLNNLMTAGFTAEKELDGITKALEGASIQWAETLKFEGLSDSLQEWIGSDGANLTGQFAELLERLGYNLEDVKKQTEGMTDAQRRAWAIQTLNANGMSDVSDAYREANEGLIAYNKANADLLHAQSQLGEEMQPFVTIVKQGTADILYSFMDMVNGVEGAGDQLLYNVGYLAGQIYKNVKDLISSMLPVLSDFFPQIINLITENLPSMLAQGVAIITNILDGITQNVPKITEQISGMLSNILLMIAENAPELLNSALDFFGQIVLAVPQMLVDLSAELPKIISTVTGKLFEGKDSVLSTAIGVLGNIVDAIPTTVAELGNNLPQIINEISTSLTEAMPSILQGAKNLLHKIIEAIPETITNLGEALPDIINEILQFLLDNAPAILEYATDMLLEIVNAIPTVVASLGTALWDILTTITQFFIDNAGEIFNIGKDIVNGIIDGIKAMASAITDVGKWIYDHTIGAILGFFGINSPSTEMRDKVGTQIVAGIVEGIKSMLSSVTDGAKWIYDNTIGKVTGYFADNSLSDIGKDVVNGVMGGIKSMGSAISEGAKWLSDNTIGRLKSWLGISSPSKVARDEVGKYLSEGVAVGMKDGEYFIADSAEELADFGIEQIKEAFDGIEEAGAEVAGTFSQGLKDGLEGKKEEIKETVETVTTEAIEEANTAVEEVATETGNAVANSVENSVDDYKDLIQGGLTSLFEGSFSGLASNALGLIPSSMGGDIISGVFDSLVSLFEKGADEGLEGRELAKTVAEGMIENLMKIFDDLPMIVDMALEFMVEFAKALAKAVPMLVLKLPQILTEICKSFIEQGVPMLYEVGKALIEGLWEGIKSIGEWLWDGVKQIGNWIVDGFKWVFGIKSPSRVMADEVGKNLALGIEEGLTDNLYTVNDALKNGVNTSLEMDGIQRKQVNVYQTNNYAQAHSRYELYKTKHDTASAVKLALQGV